MASPSYKDGTSSAAGKSGSLSLDALAKAKKALQMQKELLEKLKNIPLGHKFDRSSVWIERRRESAILSGRNNAGTGSTTANALSSVQCLVHQTYKPHAATVSHLQAGCLLFWPY
ncbi:hypothetical protein Pint_00145 [Pistacia integerrima]|uniref:Uncharacterized protein n=1 Tax=Pistacia integerrima TaxID=434235 RepID=A0ACC0ZGI0_9ROSI|nr:hypothetical protein Pint_00145 [Pistacia integerrima]